MHRNTTKGCDGDPGVPQSPFGATHALGRCSVTFDLPKDASAEAFVSEMHAGGARLVSVAPVHTTLEEIFVQQVHKAGSAREGAL